MGTALQIAGLTGLVVAGALTGVAALVVAISVGLVYVGIAADRR